MASALKIGILGFGRFGQFLAGTFVQHADVVVTSRTDYSEVADGIGAIYVPLSDPASFLSHGLDVILISVSIISFEDTVRNMIPHLISTRANQRKGGREALAPLFVDVLSVKEHPRQVMLDLLPAECDILCTHPMFGPDSGSNGWDGLRFVYERTRLGGVVLDGDYDDLGTGCTKDKFGGLQPSPRNSASEERMDRFLSIWERNGCQMVQLSCRQHDMHAANSQFVTHLTGRILEEAHNLQITPIDTKGFETLNTVIDSVVSDSFDLFYGLYKFNRYSRNIIINHRQAMDDVIRKLQSMDDENRDPQAPQESTRLLKRQRTCVAFTI